MNRLRESVTARPQTIGFPNDARLPMYTTHFELDRPLFHAGIAQDDRMLIPDRHRQRALELQARIALSTPDAAIVLLGPPGIGKTTQAAALQRASSKAIDSAGRDADEAGRDAAEGRTATAWLSTPPATGHELLEWLLAEFGLEPYKQSRAERLQTWRQFLMELAATQTRIFIAVERADEADLAVLQALDRLTAPDASGCPGANLVLMGQDNFRDMLDSPALAGLRQRVRLVRRLTPLDEHGVTEYLRQAAEAAGGAFDRLFAADALEPLTRYSRGIPRMLNNLVDSALSLCADRGTPTVTAALLHEVANEIYGLSSPAAPADAAASAPAIAAPQEEAAPADAFDEVAAAAASAEDIPTLTDWIDAQAVFDADQGALANETMSTSDSESAPPPDNERPFDSTVLLANSPDTSNEAARTNAPEAAETARAKAKDTDGEAAAHDDPQTDDDAAQVFDEVLDTLDPIATLALLEDGLDDPLPLNEGDDLDVQSDSPESTLDSPNLDQRRAEPSSPPTRRRRAAG